ncbi:hypothetical protein NE237_030651 [Protea cynaroides]|uniref:Uncharacterized protein n=1 Tax=Protea cynaroides TaxID=273540 RepID=A0A9Q0GUI1_9MAGN|nr:hypothetical protein NE237_030651 [Protea cynaroides]
MEFEVASSNHSFPQFHFLELSYDHIILSFGTNLSVRLGNSFHKGFKLSSSVLIFSFLVSSYIGSNPDCFPRLWMSLNCFFIVRNVFYFHDGSSLLLVHHVCDFLSCGLVSR